MSFQPGKPRASAVPRTAGPDHAAQHESIPPDSAHTGSHLVKAARHDGLPWWPLARRVPAAPARCSPGYRPPRRRLPLKERQRKARQDWILLRVATVVLVLTTAAVLVILSLIIATRS